MRVMLILEDISSKMGVYNRMSVILPMCKISKSGGIFMRKQNRLKITAAVLAGFMVLTDTAYAQGGISGKVLKSDIRAYINGEPVHIKDVRMGKGNNHQDYYFILDLDIQKEDINSLSIECNI